MSSRAVAMAVGLGFAALLVISFLLALKGERDWATYRDAHHCVVTGHMESSSGWGMSTDGKYVMTQIPGKILFRCDGGEIIGRSE